MRTTKQVIVMRTDLRNTKGEKVRTGKLIAQACHASMKVILDMMEEDIKEGSVDLYVNVKSGSALKNWLTGTFTKICLSTNSEESLLNLYHEAEYAGLPCALIKDAGLTEFSEPTFTCIAIGPAWSEDIDAITKGLSLL